MGVERASGGGELLEGGEREAGGRERKEKFELGTRLGYSGEEQGEWERGGDLEERGRE